MSVKIPLIVKCVCAVLFALVAEDLKLIMCSTSDCNVPEQENLYKKKSKKSGDPNTDPPTTVPPLKYRVDARCYDIDIIYGYDKKNDFPLHSINKDKH